MWIEAHINKFKWMVAYCPKEGYIYILSPPYVLKRVLHYDILIQFPASVHLLCNACSPGIFEAHGKNTDSGYRSLPGHTQIKEFVFFVLLILCVQVNKPHEAQYMFAWAQLFPKFSKAKQKSKLRNINEKLNLSGGLCGCHINMCSLFLRNSHYYIISSLCS